MADCRLLGALGGSAVHLPTRRAVKTRCDRGRYAPHRVILLHFAATKRTSWSKMTQEEACDRPLAGPEFYAFWRTYMMRRLRLAAVCLSWSVTSEVSSQKCQVACAAAPEGNDKQSPRLLASVMSTARCSDDGNARLTTAPRPASHGQSLRTICRRAGPPTYRVCSARLGALLALRLARWAKALARFTSLSLPHKAVEEGSWTRASTREAVLVLATSRTPA
jgi:hypothetical protein